MALSNHISILPEDVLIDIFEHLKGNKKQSELINATLVCKKWNRIISQTHNLMNKLQLKMNHDAFEGGAAMKSNNFTRFYRHVVWDNLYEYRYANPPMIFNEVWTFKYLNTMKISQWKPKNQKEMMENLQNLPRCKYLRSLIFKDCYICHISKDDKRIEQIQRVELNGLRRLQLFESDSFILDFIKCKELESFNYDSSSRPSADCQTIAFLNQLDRCDEISMRFQHWNFADDFKLRFLWNRLRLFCDIAASTHPNAATISSMKSFLEASATNAECDLTLWGFDSDDSTHNELSLTILNSCGKIKSLSLECPRRCFTMPFDLTQLRDLSEVRSLKIDADILQYIHNFSHFTSKIRNVTLFEIIPDRFFSIDLAHDAWQICQPFFNQLTELTLDIIILDRSSRYNERSEQNHFLSNITCENLTTIHLMNKCNSSCLKRRVTEIFPRFCQRNQNLRRMEVVGNIERNFGLAWFNQLREVSSIETCSVMVRNDENDKEDPVTVINWRVAGVDEIELFGRSLTEDENLFFI